MKGIIVEVEDGAIKSIDGIPEDVYVKVVDHDNQEIHSERGLHPHVTWHYCPHPHGLPDESHGCRGGQGRSVKDVIVSSWVAVLAIAAFVLGAAILVIA